jgi:hypothetical protein
MATRWSSCDEAEAKSEVVARQSSLLRPRFQSICHPGQSRRIDVSLCLNTTIIGQPKDRIDLFKGQRLGLQGLIHSRTW